MNANKMGKESLQSVRKLVILVNGPPLVVIEHYVRNVAPEFEVL